MSLVQKLTGVRDLKKILETTAKELWETFYADSCLIMLSNPLDPNVTSIYEYRPSGDNGQHQENTPSITMPLVLQGRTFGSVSISRDTEVSPEEVNQMRVTLGELGDIIRHAQINDIVQRDTFRDTFLVEIGNVMAYSLGIGDALFMVVNILGKVLQVSRCLFICTDDQQAGWKCYEFWQQDKLQSCQDYYWPSTSSPVVAQVLLANSPLKVFEGQQNSYVSPVQDELQFIGVKSLLGVPLRSSEATHGCVILQQCDYRRAWTRNEIDMVQNVADKVAEALVKLPAEKRAREPIMQLHQRIVPTKDSDKGSTVELRKALKGALGQQAIPSARKTSQPAAPPPPPTPPPAPPQPQFQPPPIQPVTPQQVPSPPAPPPVISAVVRGQTGQMNNPLAGLPEGVQTGEHPKFTGESGTRSLGSILGNVPRGTTAQQQAGAPGFNPPPGGGTPPQMPPPPPPRNQGGDPYADLDFGDLDETPQPQVPPATPQGSQPAAQTPTYDPFSTLPPSAEVPPINVQDAAPSMWSQSGSMPVAAPFPQASQSSQTQSQAMPVAQQPPTQADIQQPQSAPPPATPPPPTPEPAAAQGESKWGNLDAIAAPSAPPAAPAGQWGDLDSIPAPTAGPTGMGLGKAILGKRGGAGPATSPLMASFHRDKTKFQAPPAAAPPPAQAEAPPPAPIDEKKAQEKINQIMSSSANTTSDYIFATPGLDARMLGRIDGWVMQIEQKDKFTNGHSRQVAEYACAIAREIGLSQGEIDTIRQAALVHDLGKLGAAPQILQKDESELSDPELLLVMNHPMDGAELLESFPDLKHLAPIVRAHHEEYDGNGYPHGLKGDEIPVAARIISVANSYHNMVSPTRTRAGADPIAAQQDMIKGAGKQWDPTMIEGLIQSIMQKKVPAAF